MASDAFLSSAETTPQPAKRKKYDVKDVFNQDDDDLPAKKKKLPLPGTYECLISSLTVINFVCRYRNIKIFKIHIFLNLLVRDENLKMDIRVAIYWHSGCGYYSNV